MRKKKYVKISVDMFENRKLKLIENMPNRDMIEIIWMRLLLEATKINNGGLIYLEEDIPYTIEMLSVVLNRSSEDIAVALKVLRDLKMIEIDENNIIKILSWSDHQEPRRKKKVEKEGEDKKIEEKTVSNDKVDIKASEDITNVTDNITPIKQKRKKRKKKEVEEYDFCFNDAEEDVEDVFSYGDYQAPGKLIKSFKFD